METSRDTLVMIVCHEIGHLANGLLPGYITEGGEGEADYFAASICAPDVFRSYPAFHAIESAWKLPEEVSQSCQKVYSNINIEICERVNRAGLAASLMLFRLLQDSQRPSFLTPDKNQVEQTNPEGTNSQCRLDTFYSGSLRNERPRCCYKP